MSNKHIGMPFLTSFFRIIGKGVVKVFEETHYYFPWLPSHYILDESMASLASLLSFSLVTLLGLLLLLYLPFSLLLIFPRSSETCTQNRSKEQELETVERNWSVWILQDRRGEGSQETRKGKESS
jgi:hypothetical protein